MSSIRRRLLGWLLAGLGLLWLVGSVVVYVTVRTSLTRAFDAELQAVASDVRYLLPEGHLLGPSAPSSYSFDFFQSESGLYFEVWDADLLFSDRSPNLGTRSLPQPERFGTQPHIQKVTLETGERVRLLSQRFVVSRPGEQNGHVMNVVVARNRENLDRSLALLLAALGLMGALIVPLAGLIVRVAVGRGLRPLRDLAAHVAQVDVDRLEERFPVGALPHELLPVAQRLNELMERLEAGLERERRLNADLAHELRTPVAELKTTAEVAVAWPDQINSDSYGEVLGIAKDMESIVEGMLLLARWDQGIECPPMDIVDVEDVMKTCWQAYAQQADEKGLQMQWAMVSVFTAETNRDLLHRVLSNLLSNAVAHSPQGGDICIQDSSKNGRRAVTVSNSVREAFREEHLPHLFDRFWRGEVSRKGEGRAGLGLSVAKLCADILGLDLSVNLDKSLGMIRFSLSFDGVKRKRGAG